MDKNKNLHPNEITILKKIYEKKDDELLQKFSRSLPFQDSIIDRWERARKLGFGEGTSIYNSSFVFGNVKIGNNTWIGPNTMLDGSSDILQIGSFCSLSAGVHVYTHDSVLWALSGGEIDKKIGPVTIEDRCYIGSQSIITKGIKIGFQSVIAANSLVNSDVPEKTIYGGSPAKKIGYISGTEKKPELVFEKIKSIT